ncbi:hypothetical protein MKY30_13005 [Oceanobacillus sp. FSL W8-0428]|uniref:hypothetical protein n=1 Tax=Oceanobacillus sp. FSL W8-0428 TaxID=2921715 RepID=UPI0030FD1626
MDHSHHHHNYSDESEVKATVTYKDGKISISLEDNTGKAPELALAHEKELHFIMVSNDLSIIIICIQKKSRMDFIRLTTI